VRLCCRRTLSPCLPIAIHQKCRIVFLDVELIS
jgi:hypothetical protein